MPLRLGEDTGTAIGLKSPRPTSGPNNCQPFRPLPGYSKANLSKISSFHPEIFQYVSQQRWHWAGAGDCPKAERVGVFWWRPVHQSVCVVAGGGSSRSSGCWDHKGLLGTSGPRPLCRPLCGASFSARSSAAPPTPVHVRGRVCPEAAPSHFLDFLLPPHPWSCTPCFSQSDTSRTALRPCSVPSYKPLVVPCSFRIRFRTQELGLCRGPWDFPPGHVPWSHTPSPGLSPLCSSGFALGLVSSRTPSWHLGLDYVLFQSHQLPTVALVR